MGKDRIGQSYKIGQYRRKIRGGQPSPCDPPGIPQGNPELGHWPRNVMSQTINHPSTILAALRSVMGAIAGAKGTKLALSQAGQDRAGNPLLTVKGEREVTFQPIALPAGALSDIVALLGQDVGNWEEGRNAVGSPEAWELVNKSGKALAKAQEEAGKWESLWHESKEQLAELKVDRDALARTVDKLRRELETAKANVMVPAPGKVATLVLAFPVGQQSKILRACKLDVDGLKGAGFKWRFHNQKEPSDGGQWEAQETPEALATMRAISAFL